MDTSEGKGIREVGVASRLDRREAIECAFKVVDLFQRAGYHVKVEYYMYKKLQRMLGGKVVGEPILIGGLGRADLLVVIGGDGTLLRLLHYIDAQVRVVGVRVGRRGFLMNFECNDKDINDVVLGRYDFLYMPRLRVENMYTPPAINEVAIIAARGKTVALDVTINCGAEEEYYMRLRGDGIIISTMIGSFAYNLSAGGPLIRCKECIAVTPLNPIPGDANPIVVRNACGVGVRVREGYRAPWLVIDGQYTLTLPIGSEIVVRAGDGIWVATKRSGRPGHDV